MHCPSLACGARFYQIRPLPDSTAQKGTPQGLSKPGAWRDGWPRPKHPTPTPAVWPNFTGTWLPSGSPGYPTQGPGQMGGGTREDTLGPKGTLCACQLTLRIPGTREGKRQGYHQGDALGQDPRSCPSEVQIPIRIPAPASPPPCTLTPRIPPRNGLAHALLEVSDALALMSPLPLRNPYFSGSPDPPTPRSPLLTCAAPRAITFAPGGVRPSRGSRVPPPPESSDAHSTTRPPSPLPSQEVTEQTWLKVVLENLAPEEAAERHGAGSTAGQPLPRTDPRPLADCPRVGAQGPPLLPRPNHCLDPGRGPAPQRTNHDPPGGPAPPSRGPISP